MRNKRALFNTAFLSLAVWLCADISAHTLSTTVVEPPTPPMARSTPTATPVSPPGDWLHWWQPVSLPSSGVKPSDRETPWDPWLQDPEAHLRLKGTLLGEDTTLAYLEADKSLMTVSLGQVLGQWRVTGISDHDITFLAPHGRTVVLALWSSGQKALPRSAPAAPSGPVFVERSDLLKLLQQPGNLRLDMERDGVAITQTTPALEHLGLLAGDLVLSVSGQDVRSADQLAVLLSLVETADSLSLHQQRQGHPVDLLFLVR